MTYINGTDKVRKGRQVKGKRKGKIMKGRERGQILLPIFLSLLSSSSFPSLPPSSPSLLPFFPPLSLYPSSLVKVRKGKEKGR